MTGIPDPSHNVRAISFSIVRLSFIGGRISLGLTFGPVFPLKKSPGETARTPSCPLPSGFPILLCRERHLESESRKQRLEHSH